MCLRETYHPAFGEMCLSLLYLKKLAHFLTLWDRSREERGFRVEAGRTSAFVGQHKGNTSALKRIRPQEIKVRRPVPTLGPIPGAGIKSKLKSSMFTGKYCVRQIAWGVCFVSEITGTPGL